MLFLKGIWTPEKPIISHYYRCKNGTFVEAVLEVQRLNVLQLAVYFNLPQVANYILHQKGFDPRIIILGTDFD